MAGFFLAATATCKFCVNPLYISGLNFSITFISEFFSLKFLTSSFIVPPPKLSDATCQYSISIGLFDIIVFSSFSHPTKNRLPKIIPFKIFFFKIIPPPLNFSLF